VRAAFDGGSLTSDPGVLVLAEIVRRLGIADRLAGCLSDLRDPDRIRHTLAEIIRFRTLMIAAGYVTKMVALIKVSSRGLRLPRQPRHARRPRRQAPALPAGAACPRTNLSRQPSNPDCMGPRRHTPTRLNRLLRTPHE